MRRQWRTLAFVAVCGLGWYLVSAQAAHGDWTWPVRYVRTLQGYYAADFLANTYKAFTLPTVLMAMGFVRPIVGFLVAAILFAVALPLLARASALEAGSMATLVGLAASVHAWPYEAVLLLPAIFYAMTRLEEVWRTRIVVTAYVVVAVGMVTYYGALPLAVVASAEVHIGF